MHGEISVSSIIPVPTICKHNEATHSGERKEGQVVFERTNTLLLFETEMDKKNFFSVKFSVYCFVLLYPPLSFMLFYQHSDSVQKRSKMGKKKFANLQVRINCAVRSVVGNVIG